MKPLSANPSTVPPPSRHRARGPGACLMPTLGVLSALSFAPVARAQYQDVKTFDSPLLESPYDIALFDPCVNVFNVIGAGQLDFLGGTPFAFVSDETGPLHQYRINGSPPGQWFATYDVGSGDGFDDFLVGGLKGVAVNDIPSHPNFGQVYVCGEFGNSTVGNIRVYEIRSNAAASGYQRLEFRNDFYGPPGWGILFDCKGLAVDSDGDIYVTALNLDTDLQEIFKFSGEDVAGGYGDTPVCGPGGQPLCTVFADYERRYSIGLDPWDPYDVSVSSFDKVLSVISKPENSTTTGGTVYRFQNGSSSPYESDHIGVPPNGCGHQFGGVCSRDLSRFDPQPACEPGETRGPLGGNTWVSKEWSGAGGCPPLSRVQRRGKDLSISFESGVNPILSRPRGLEHGRSWTTVHPGSSWYFTFGDPQTRCRERLFVCNQDFGAGNIKVLEDSFKDSVALHPDAVAWWGFDDKLRPANHPHYRRVVNKINGAANGVKMGGVIPSTSFYSPRTAEGVVRCATSATGIAQDGWIEVPDHPSVNFSGDLTIEGWIRARLETSFRVFAFKRRTDHPKGYSVYLGGPGGGQLSFQTKIDGSVTNLETTAPELMLADEKWHHFAVTFANDDSSPTSTGVVKFYVDGCCKETRTMPATGTGDLSNDEPLLLLRHGEGLTTRGLNGELDELTFYKSVLSDSQVSAIYGAGSAGKSPKAKGIGPVGGGFVVKCFVGPTPVQVPGGTRRIDALQSGDPVLAYDLESGALVETEVLEVQSWKGSWDLAQLALGSGEVVEVVPHHYFLVDGEWRYAESLLDAGLEDMRARTMTGQDELVSLKERTRTKPDTLVYNLRVASHGNYLVGEAGLVARDH